MQEHPSSADDDFAVAHREWLRERVAHYLGRPVPDTAPLDEEGFDSVAALSLYGDIEDEFGTLIDPEDIWTYPTVRELAGFLAMRDSRREPGRVRAAFVFTGQGSQHPGMTAGLHLHSTGYRTFLEEADAALLPHTRQSMAELILGDDPRIHRTALAQPALFAVGYALARTLQEAGVQPVAVLGHGIGEFAAATVAGALTLDDAAGLVSLRGASMQRLPPGGGMMATCITPRRRPSSSPANRTWASAPSTPPSRSCSPATVPHWSASRRSSRNGTCAAGTWPWPTPSTRR